MDSCGENDFLSSTLLFLLITPDGVSQLVAHISLLDKERADCKLLVTGYRRSWLKSSNIVLSSFVWIFFLAALYHKWYRFPIHGKHLISPFKIN